MQKKKAVVTGIGVVVVIAGILGVFMLHKDGEAVEAMAEATEQTAETAPPTAGEDSTALPEEAPKEAEAQPQTVENTDTEETLADTADAEQETEVSQEDGGKQDMAELAKDEEMEEIDAYLYTTADLNMRKEGTTDSEVIGSIPYGTQIHVTARTADNWYRTERGEIGFVSGKYLSDTKPEQNTSSQQASSETTESSSDTSTTSQSSGGAQSSVPGISQAEMDKIDAALAGLQPYTGPTSSNAGDGGGGRHLNN